MPVTAIVGTLWGDEAKGKFVDLLAGEAALTLRFNGGSNAGHTIVNDHGTFKLRLVPCGIFHEQSICIIGPGVMIDPAVLLAEISMLEKVGISVRDRLFISPRCHLIFPYHRVLERLYEEAKGEGRTGTSGSGMGPGYADKVSYNGIRLSDLQRQNLFKEKLSIQTNLKNRIISALGGEALDGAAISTTYSAYGNELAPYIFETFGLVQETVRSGQKVLLEGAQAALLDPDWGAYPYVTGGTTLTAAATAGAGLPPGAIDKVIGICKAYSSRVGNGPMPTELKDETAEQIRQKGNEYGTNTGRARRVGWFDTAAIRFSAMLNGLTELALTKIDVLDELAEIKIGRAYEYAGKEVEHYDGDAEFLAGCRPVYETVAGWQGSLAEARTFGELPLPAQVYIERLAELTQLKITFIGTGPHRNETIAR